MPVYAGGKSTVRASANEMLTQQTQAVWAAIRRMVRATEHYSSQLQRQTGLTTAKLTVLRRLAEVDGTSLAPLAESIGISQATLTVLVVQLESKGLVIRRRDEEDRRRIHLHLTEAGWQMLSSAPSLIQESFQQRLADLSEQERQQVITILQQVAAMMDSPAAPVELFSSEELV